MAQDLRRICFASNFQTFRRQIRRGQPLLRCKWGADSPAKKSGTTKSFLSAGRYPSRQESIEVCPFVPKEFYGTTENRGFLMGLSAWLICFHRQFAHAF